MWQVFGELLPLAVAAAVSSMPIMAMLVILISPRRGESALPFLTGWVLGTLALVALGTVAAQAIPVSRTRRTETSIGVLEIVIGLALVVLGVVTMLRRSETATGPMPRWVNAIDSFGSLPAFGIGLALNVRPKSVLLGAAASLALRGGSLDLEETVLMIAVYAAIATSTVSIPTLATLLYPERMLPRLNATRDWLTANGMLVTGLIMIMIGAVVIGAGLGRL